MELARLLYVDRSRRTNIKTASTGHTDDGPAFGSSEPLLSTV
jgi:hypothetical protein